MCFIGNSRWEDELRDIEHHVVQNEQELEEANSARNREVMDLTLEATSLRVQLGVDGTCGLLARGVVPRPQGAEGMLLPVDLLDAKVTAGADVQATEAQVNDLQQELETMRHMHQDDLRRVVEAREKAALLGARLAVLRESHAQEVSDLRAQLQPSAPVAEAKVDSTAAVEAAERRRQCPEVLRRASSRVLVALEQPPLAASAAGPTDPAAWLQALILRLEAA